MQLRHRPLVFGTLFTTMLATGAAFAHGAHRHGHGSEPARADDRAHAHAHGHEHEHEHKREHEHDHGHGHGHGHDGHTHGAHVHGLAHLDAALDGRTLLIEVRTPGWDLVGFERAPRDDDERARIDAARRTLSDAARLVAFEPEGACTPAAPAKVILPTSIDPGSATAGDAHPGDWSVAWSFDCADPESLRAVRIDWFDAFPETQRIAVQWIGPDGQAGLELGPASRRIAVRGR